MTKSTDWGGKREGAGRPPGQPQQLLRIAATDAEYQEIIEALNTRQRTTALLKVVVRMEDSDD